MHAGLMPNGRVVFLDKVENYTQIKLPDGQYAYSAEYVSYWFSDDRKVPRLGLRTSSHYCF